jgi:hypothetical protein
VCTTFACSVKPSVVKFAEPIWRLDATSADCTRNLSCMIFVFVRGLKSTSERAPTAALLAPLSDAAASYTSLVGLARPANAGITQRLSVRW